MSKQKIENNFPLLYYPNPLQHLSNNLLPIYSTSEKKGTKWDGK